jgi:NADP-reducing hydrogenase subunit HndB
LKLKAGDLNRIKEKMNRTRTLAQDGTAVRITVHMGTCGIAAGAREVLAAFADEIKKRRLQRIAITTSGCVGLCSREPMATVETCNDPPVKYANLTAEKVKRIVGEHVAKGKIVKDCALATGSESTAL